MELTTLIKELRSQRLFDTVEQYLWPSEELVSYFDAAQDAFFEATGWVIDSSSPLTKLSLRAGRDTVARSDRIVRVLEARLLDGSARGKLLDLVVSVPLVRTAGEPTAMAVGNDAGSFVFDRTPTVDTVVLLRVERRSLEPLESTSSELEVPPAHARVLLDYVEYLAYSKPDTETRDTRRAEKAEQRFMAGCARASAAKRRGNTPVLTTGYGGY